MSARAVDEIYSQIKPTLFNYGVTISNRDDLEPLLRVTFARGVSCRKRINSTKKVLPQFTHREEKKKKKKLKKKDRTRDETKQVIKDNELSDFFYACQFTDTRNP